MSSQQRYRLRNSATGREVVLSRRAGARSTSTASPANRSKSSARCCRCAPSSSRLPWAVENLRFCPWCEQLAQKDLNECPTCGRRMGPPGAERRLALLAACVALLSAASALSACGGSSVSDAVPKSTPEITPPTDTSAETRGRPDDLDRRRPRRKRRARAAKQPPAPKAPKARAATVPSPAAARSEAGTAGGAPATEEPKARRRSHGKPSNETGASSPTGGASAP